MTTDRVRRSRSALRLVPCAWPDRLFTGPAPGVTPMLESRGGDRFALDPQRWHAEPGPADLALLERVRGSVLDIGCGPGRLVGALVRAGRPALGIDASAAAVATARQRGAPAVQASVFGPVPAAGAWGTALLIDGNIGIGGDAAALLRRVRRLVVPDGLVLVEVEPPLGASGDVEVRVDDGGHRSGWFRWSRVAARDLSTLADASGLVLDDVWHHSGRWFAQLAGDGACNHVTGADTARRTGAGRGPTSSDRTEVGLSRRDEAS